ncbi:hypothetical protein GNX71_18460 [Variovorax sp. RKNM96]|uniref:hypothetical protein n=1 Tax=Variovorax sp. RKNM96 TaxID=2681552 RepID=UPI00197E08A7|nr:hypothetical protein [Variovorax sp. RKNM96]QSI31453.1 hypothetical protein GNX71_18460 [Variovorax sp. RKNM96]
MKTKHIVNRADNSIEAGSAETTDTLADIIIGEPDVANRVRVTIDDQFMGSVDLREAAKLFKKLADVLDAVDL